MITHDLLTFASQVPDSLANAIGQQVGALVTAKLILGLGIVAKLITSGFNVVANKVANLESKIPPAYSNWVKAGIAWAFSQGTVIANNFLSAHHLPALSADPSKLNEWVLGLVTFGLAMGVHHFLKSTVTPAISGGTTPPATPASK